MDVYPVLALLPDEMVIVGIFSTPHLAELAVSVFKQSNPTASFAPGTGQAMSIDSLTTHADAVSRFYAPIAATTGALALCAAAWTCEPVFGATAAAVTAGAEDGVAPVASGAGIGVADAALSAAACVSGAEAASSAVASEPAA